MTSGVRFYSKPRFWAAILASVICWGFTSLFYYEEGAPSVDKVDEIKRAEERINYYLSEIEKHRFMLAFYDKMVRGEVGSNVDNQEGVPEGKLTKDEFLNLAEVSLPNWNSEYSYSDFSDSFDYLERQNREKALAIVLDEYAQSPMRYDFSDIWGRRKELKEADWNVGSNEILFTQSLGVGGLGGIAGFFVSYLTLYMLHWLWYFVLERIIELVRALIGRGPMKEDPGRSDRPAQVSHVDRAVDSLVEDASSKSGDSTGSHEVTKVEKLTTVQNVSSESNILEPAVNPQPSCPGIGRGFYVLFLVVIFAINYGVARWSVHEYYHSDPSKIEMTKNTMTVLSVIASLFITGARLSNIGRKPVMALLGLIPFINLYIGLLCLVAPAGYAKTKHLDPPGKIIAGTVIALFVVMLLSIIPLAFE